MVIFQDAVLNPLPMSVYWYPEKCPCYAPEKDCNGRGKALALEFFSIPVSHFFHSDFTRKNTDAFVRI